MYKTKNPNVNYRFGLIMTCLSWYINCNERTTLLGDISRRYYYLDGAASHVISIKTAETTHFEMDSCEGISKIDLSNF